MPETNKCFELPYVGMNDRFLRMKKVVETWHALSLQRNIQNLFYIINESSSDRYQFIINPDIPVVDRSDVFKVYQIGFMNL